MPIDEQRCQLAAALVKTGDSKVNRLISGKLITFIFPMKDTNKVVICINDVIVDYVNEAQYKSISNFILLTGIAKV